MLAFKLIPRLFNICISYLFSILYFSEVATCRITKSLSDPVSGVCYTQLVILGFPGGSDGKESACSAGDPGSMPRSGRSTGEGNGNTL